MKFIQKYQKVYGNKLDNDDNIIGFPVKYNNNSMSFKLKEKITEKTNNNGIIDVEIVVPLKHL